MYNFKRCSPRGERQDSPRSRGHNPVISIHAPRVGSDPSLRSWRRRRTDFNPRSPCGERPTPEPPGRLPPGDFNPRSPCGERLQQSIKIARSGISIHAPRVGSDPYWCTSWSTSPDFNPRSPCGERPSGFERRLCFMNFNPRSPCGERQCPGWNVPLPCGVSIHAPRVGSDQPPPPGLAGDGDFNPRSPCGERRPGPEPPGARTRFQSTLPVWGATASKIRIFIHFLFQSTLPVWGATARRERAAAGAAISIHAPRVGSDALRAVCPSILTISIHAPRVGSDLRGFAVEGPPECISIHAPRVGSDATGYQGAASATGFQSTLPVWGATHVGRQVHRVD